MNEPNFWAIRFIQPPVPDPIIRPLALSPQPPYYADAKRNFAKLKPQRIHKF